MAEQPIFRTIREQVVHRLRDDIMGQVYPPGENLREYTLSKRYGVSRSPIRDALLQLTQEGLLVATPNCGVKVASKLNEEMQPLVVDIRRRIEGFALDRAMKQMTDEGHDLMKERLQALKVACEKADLPAIIKGDMGFHSGIIELSENEELFNLWKPIIAGMMLHYDRHRGDWMECYQEHKQILDAIIEGDRKTARAALKANIK